MIKLFIFIALISMTFVCQSQVLDTTIKSISAFKISPVKANISDILLTNRVGVRGLVDDYKTSLMVYVQLLNASKDSTGITLTRQVSEWNETLSGSDYTNYDGSPEFIIRYLSKKYGFVF